MAKKKKAGARKSPARRSPARKKAGGRRRSVKRMDFTGAIVEVAKGVGGAVVAAMVADKVPVKDPKMRYGLLTAAAAYGATKPGPLRSVFIGASIGAGMKLAVEVFPKLQKQLGANAGAAGKSIGRLDPATVRMMQEAASRMRTINGPRNRTIVGNGGGPEAPQSVTGAGDGYRMRTIVGGGYGPDGDGIV